MPATAAVTSGQVPAASNVGGVDRIMHVQEVQQEGIAEGREEMVTARTRVEEVAAHQHGALWRWRFRCDETGAKWGHGVGQCILLQGGPDSDPEGRLCAERIGEATGRATDSHSDMDITLLEARAAEVERQGAERHAYCTGRDEYHLRVRWTQMFDRKPKAAPKFFMQRKLARTNVGSIAWRNSLYAPRVHRSRSRSFPGSSAQVGHR